MLTLAAQILKRKVAEVGPKAFRDRYEEALLARLKTKRVGAVREEGLRFAAPRRVTNLMEALRQSLLRRTRSRRPGDPQAGREVS
jgi:non-homologous end joining protein Ku